MAKKSWFQTGNAGWKRAKEADEEAKERRENQDPWRFRLKNSTSGKVTFLDTPTFFCHEHNLKVKGKYGNYFTCLKDIDTCLMCEEDLNPAYICAGTVIDHTVYIDKEGKKHTNRKRLFVAKGRAREKLERQIEKRDDDMKYCVYEMARGSGQTECATGEDYEYVGRLKKAQLKKLIPQGEDESWLEPYDYEKVFAPKPTEKIARVLGISAPVGSDDDDAGGSDDGDVNVDDLVGGDDDKDSKKETKKKGKAKEKDDDNGDLDIDDLL